MTRIEISGPEQSKKTTLMVLLSRFLQDELGVNVITQQADPQLDEKLAADTAELREKVKGMTLVITEMRTAL